MTAQNYHNSLKFLRNQFTTYCEQKRYIDPIMRGKTTIEQVELTKPLYDAMRNAIIIYEGVQAEVEAYEREHNLRPTSFH